MCSLEKNKLHICSRLNTKMNKIITPRVVYNTPFFYPPVLATEAPLEILFELDNYYNIPTIKLTRVYFIVVSLCLDTLFSTRYPSWCHAFSGSFVTHFFSKQCNTDMLADLSSSKLHCTHTLSISLQIDTKHA